MYPKMAQDGIDFADFLGLAREHLDLAEVVKYLETPPQPPSEPWPVNGSMEDLPWQENPGDGQRKWRFIKFILCGSRNDLGIQVFF